MSRVAGIELDRHGMRLAIFEGSPKKYSLVDFVQVDLDSESEHERQEQIRSALESILEQKENKGLEFYSSLDSRETFLREISVPMTKDELIAKTIRFEAESYLHSMSIDDVIIEYLKCSEVGESSRLLICAAPKEKIAKHLALLQACQADPLAVEIDATAMATAFSNTPLFSAEQNVLLVQVDEHSTRLVFLEGGKLIKVRTVVSQSSVGRGVVMPERDIPSNDPLEESQNDLPQLRSEDLEQSPFDEGADIQDEIAKRFEAIEKSLEDLDHEDPEEELPFVVLSDEDYESLRGQSGVDQDEIPGGASETGSDPSNMNLVPVGGAAAVAEEEQAPVGSATLKLAAYGETDPLSRLFLEIERTFAAYVLSNSIDLMVVTGTRAAELEVVTRLQDYFEADVTSFDFGDSFPVKWEGDLESLNRCGVVACGLGLRGLKKGATQFDLRREEFRFERRFARLMPSLTLSGLILCLLSVLWMLSVRSQYQLYELEHQYLLKSQAGIAKEFFQGPVSPQPDYYLASARKLKNLLRGGGASSGRSRGKVKEYLSPVILIQDFMTGVLAANPPIYPSYQLFDIDTEIGGKNVQSKIKVVVASQDEATRLIAAVMSNTQYFHKTRSLAPTKVLKDSRVEVSFDLVLKASAGKQKP